MANFSVIKGAALGKAIAGQGKAIATFTAREHQLAYSALVHMEAQDDKPASNDVKYLNALLEVTPANYRAGLIGWATAFGRVSYDAKERVFAYAKGKTADLEGAMNVAPANYAKDSNKANAAPAKSLMERVESAANKAIENADASAEDKVFARALNNFLAAHKRSLVKPVQSTPVRKEKPAKAEKVAKVEAPAQAEMLDAA